MIPGPPIRSSKAAPKAWWDVVGTMLVLSVGLAIPLAWGGEMMNDPKAARDKMGTAALAKARPSPHGVGGAAATL